MEQQEEQIQIKRRRQSSSSSSLPQDIISEILLKLPVKSVARFRCVSKHWSSISTNSYFINKFKTPSVLLLPFRAKDKLFVFSIPSSSSSSSKPVEYYHMEYPKHWSFSSEVSVHGLLCFINVSSSNPITIWNPTTRQFVKLSKPEKRWKYIACFLGYDPIEGIHKVVCMPDDTAIDECCVWTLGLAQETWRKIKKTKHKPKYGGSCYHCINGVLYYQAKMDDDDDLDVVMMSFDVRSEKFNTIKLPWIKDKMDGGLFKTYKGKLAYLNFNTLWILEDAEKHEWSCLHFPVTCSYYDWNLGTSLYLNGVTDSGEFVYLPCSFLESFYILFCDPKRNSFRIVEYKGIVNKEFRLKNGLGNKRFSIRACADTVSNHMESLMSL